MSTEARQMFERIVNEGNWDAAINHASTMKNSVPWAVLVTGVNGIRKTTAMYQSVRYLMFNITFKICVLISLLLVVS